MSETKDPLVSRPLFAAVISFAMIAGATAGGAELMPKGFDKVVKQAETAYAQLSMSETKLKGTLEACRGVVDGSSKASLDSLKGSVQDSHEQLGELQKAVKKMDDDSTHYFTEWERSLLDLDGIERTTASDMRSEYWDLFHKVSDDAVDSQNELQPILDDLEKLAKTLEQQASDASGQKTALAAITKKADAWFSDVDKRQKAAKDAIQELTGR